MADRRESLKLALGAALLPILSSRTLLAQTPGGSGAISPPANSMIYSRTLFRDLSGSSQAIVVRRDFEVRFTPLAAGGFIIRGNQVNVDVEVPDKLAGLAKFERQRVESGIFPLQLDAQGQIVDWPAMSPSAQLAAALDEVRDQFTRDSEEVGILIEALHSAGNRMVAILPTDLFAPVQPEREDRQQVELPWGDSGEVMTRFEAARDPGTHLMRRAQRSVITRLGGEQRESREVWELFQP